MRFRLLVLATLVISTSAYSQLLSGEVVGVEDGDRIRLRAAGEELFVRVYGVDAPEREQARHADAEAYTAREVLGDTVTVSILHVSVGGDYVGNVSLSSGRDLAESLVRAGWAWWDKAAAPKAKNLALLHTEALLARRGLWADDSPVAPWDYRATHTTDPFNPQTDSVFEQAIHSRDTNDPRDAASVVYADTTDKVYHTIRCAVVGKESRGVGLGEALFRGFSPCAECEPPDALPEPRDSGQAPRGERPQDRYFQAVQSQLEREALMEPTPSLTPAPKPGARTGTSIPGLVVTPIPQRGVQWAPVGTGPRPAQTGPVVGIQTVYVTHTGHKYHRLGCRYLVESQAAIALSNAVSRGFGACSVCRP